MLEVTIDTTHLDQPSNSGWALTTQTRILSYDEARQWVKEVGLTWPELRTKQKLVCSPRNRKIITYRWKVVLK